MKKYILSFIAMTFLFSGIAYADTSSTTNEIKQKIHDLKQEVNQQKTNLKNLKQDLKDAIEIKIGKKLDAQKIKIANEFEMAIKNLNNLADRVQSRILKMQISNINASSSQVLLDAARAKISLAETEVTNLENLISQEIPNATSTTLAKQRKTILQSIKTESNVAKKAIKTAHSAIVDAINSLKPGQNKEDNSTSTQENSSTSTR